MNRNYINVNKKVWRVKHVHEYENNAEYANAETLPQ